MKQNVLVTCAALAGVCILTSFILLFNQLRSAPKTSLPEPSQELPLSQQSACPYILKSYEGKLAVFLPGEPVPQKVFDVWLSSLPQYDRGQLELGIPVESYPELVQRIEDYIS